MSWGKNSIVSPFSGSNDYRKTGGMPCIMGVVLGQEIYGHRLAMYVERIPDDVYPLRLVPKILRSGPDLEYPYFIWMTHTQI